MDTKEELKFNIKGYLEYDRKIKRLQNEIKLLKAEQKKASYNLMDIMRSNDIDCFDLNNLISILFIGSGARCEMSFKVYQDKLDIFSDYEFV